MNRHIKLVIGTDYYFHPATQIFRVNEATLVASWVADELLSRTDPAGNHLFIEL